MSKHADTLALLDELRAKGVRRVELNAEGGIHVVEFDDASPGEPTAPAEEKPDPAFAGVEAAIRQVQRAAFERRQKS